MTMSPRYFCFDPSTLHEHPCRIFLSGDHVDLGWMSVRRSAEVSGKSFEGGALRTAPPSGAKKPQSRSGGMIMQKQYMAILAWKELRSLCYHRE